MKKSLLFSFNVLTLLIILVLVAGGMGQRNKNIGKWCPETLDNQKPGSCLNKQVCLSACKKRMEVLGKKELKTLCTPGNICGCYSPCPK
ncbi:hypothetical protein N665_0703s0006 [Sinapis alba]|nr:hypothetical protein N665_0703s0006 [Sinapis alba]